MKNKKPGRNWRAKYLQRDDFWAWVENDFCHLTKTVKLNRKLLIGIFLAVILVPFAMLFVFIQIIFSFLG